SFVETNRNLQSPIRVTGEGQEPSWPSFQTASTVSRTNAAVGAPQINLLRLRFVAHHALVCSPSRSMRVRIVKPMAGIIDGVSLGRFIPTLTYEVGASLGHHLIAIGGATAIAPSDPSSAITLDWSIDEAHVVGGVTIVPPTKQIDDP